MRLAQAAKPEDGSHAIELPAELIHRNRSLIAPLGSRILTFPENVSAGSPSELKKLKTSTEWFGGAIGFTDGSMAATMLLHVPMLIVQPPFSSKVTVKARAGDGTKASPAAANAATPSANRFMIGAPLDRLSHPRPAWCLKSPVVNLSQGVIFWTTMVMSQKRSAR